MGRRECRRHHQGAHGRHCGAYIFTVELSGKQYHDIVDYWGHTLTAEREKTRFLPPLGNRIPLWMFKNTLFEEKRARLQIVCLTMCAENKLHT